MGYQDLRNSTSFGDLQTKLVAYAKQYYTSLKNKLVNTYQKIKLHFQNVFKETVEMMERAAIIAIKSRLAALKAYIKSQIAAMKKELPVIIGKIEKMVTEEATKLERGLKELVEKIKKSEEFLALKRKVEELKKFIKRIINKLKNNPTLQKITAKGKEIVKMTKEYTKQCIKLLKEELPKVINDIERIKEMIVKSKLIDFIKTQFAVLKKFINE